MFIERGANYTRCSVKRQTSQRMRAQELDLPTKSGFSMKSEYNV